MLFSMSEVSTFVNSGAFVSGMTAGIAVMTVTVVVTNTVAGFMKWVTGKKLPKIKINFE